MSIINVDSYESSDSKSSCETEAILWQRLLRGDPRALETLFRTFYPVLFDYGIKFIKQEELVKDGIQEVFAYIWEKRKKVSRVESVKSYLVVCLRRQLLSALQKRQRRQTAHSELRLEMKNAFSYDDLTKSDREHYATQDLHEAFETIPARMREALYLKTYDEFSYKEIAAIMDIQPQVARNYVSEALQRLRVVLTH